MSTVKLSDQISDLRHRIGDTDSSSYIYTANADNTINDLYTYLAKAVDDFNEESSPQYEIKGTSTDQYYSPDPTDTDRKLLYLYAAKRVMQNEWIKASRVAMSFGNTAGRENFVELAKALKSVLDDIEDEIRALLPGYEIIKDYGITKSSFADRGKKMEYGYVYCEYCGRLKSDCTCGTY